MSDSSTRNSIKSLTGLRFCAALLVFVSHLPGAFDEATFNPHTLGFAGVGFFFVLSGFILTYVYIGREFSTRAFYIKRVARVWPLHLATAAIFLTFIYSLSIQIARPYGGWQLVLNTVLLQSWVPIDRWVFCINGPSWSLSVEAFFYLMFPLLLAGGVKSITRKLIAICLLTATAIAVLTFQDLPGFSQESQTFLIRANPIFRLYDFLTGMLAGALFVRSQSRPAASRLTFGTLAQCTAVALCAGYYWMCYLGFGMFTDSGSALAKWIRIDGPAPLFAALIYIFASSRGGLTRVLSWRPLEYLGEISYAFYLIHLPILTWVSKYQQNELSLSWLWMIAGCLLSALAAAMLLHHWVELPCRSMLLKLKGRTKRPTETTKTRSTSALRWLGLTSLAALLGCAGVSSINMGRMNYFDTAAQNAIIAASPQEFKDVRFDQDAILLGLERSHNPDGSWILKMVWELREGRRENRFLHICDRNGKILRMGDPNQAMFKWNTGNVRLIDHVSLEPDQTRDAHFVATGFHSPDRKRAPVFFEGQPIKQNRLRILELSVRDEVEQK